MAQTQFISHIPVAPPPAVTTRKSSGALSAIIIVLAILIGAGTAGVVIMQKSFETQAAEKEKELAQLKSDLEIPSIMEAKDLQNRIAAAQQLLASHIYGSQAFNFVEDNILPGVAVSKFDYVGGKISLTAESSGYVLFAQQVRHLRSSPDVASVVLSIPKLTVDGKIAFDLAIDPKPEFMRTKPPLITSTNISLSAVPPAPERVSDCGTDELCLYKQIALCNASTTKTPEESGFQFSYQVTKEDGARCVVKVTTLKNPSNAPRYKSSSMECRIAKDIAPGALAEYVTPLNCSGGLSSELAKNDTAAEAALKALLWNSSPGL